MAKKELKINIKNTQIAEAIQLDKLKRKLATKKADAEKPEEPKAKKAKAEVAPSKKPTPEEEQTPVEEMEEQPRRKARSKSAFAEPSPEVTPEVEEEAKPKAKKKAEKKPSREEVSEEEPDKLPKESEAPPVEETAEVLPEEREKPAKKPKVEKEVLGPTGRHIKDLIPPKFEGKKPSSPKETEKKEKPKEAAKKEVKKPEFKQEDKSEESFKKGGKPPRFKEYRDVKPSRKEPSDRFDARDRRGLRSTDEGGQRWRKKRQKQEKSALHEDLTIRPKSLSVRVPIAVKDLASEMKLKASQLIEKLFLQGIVVTINDLLEDDTTIQLLGEEFGCEITIDTSEEEKIRITDKTIKEEISETDPSKLKPRAPVVTFMGHVDHGKTSLIDYIRKKNTVLGEAGAITQHIGAFKVKTDVGDISILDTPGHEAFSEMRARGADVTDIVVLVVAGDEGMRAQTEEAIDHAKAAGVIIVVAINKSDKPNFDQEKIYRQLADHELLPESWGGQTIAINCSAVTGDGVQELLEMLALQAEVLELKANPDTRARGSVLESELHKGLGAVSTVLVQNGTLKTGDPLVFGENWGRVKTMHDEFGNDLEEATPSTPVEITGLSGLPEAGDEFIVVKSEKAAREIAEKREIGKRQLYLQQSRKTSLENIFQEAADKPKKILKVVLRADVQGSLEALKAALLKIHSEKVDLDIISSGVGEISESDVLLAAASKAMIIGFHTQVEAHAEQLLKQHGVHVSLHDVIYHAIDDIKQLMTGLLDKLAQETDRGKAKVIATFKASQLGVIAGCLVTDGTIHRNHNIRVIRDGELIWKGAISSIKRVKEDVREVQKGVECGIVLSNYNDVQVDDILEAYETTYSAQEL